MASAPIPSRPDPSPASFSRRRVPPRRHCCFKKGTQLGPTGKTYLWLCRPALLGHFVIVAPRERGAFTGILLPAEEDAIGILGVDFHDPCPAPQALAGHQGGPRSGKQIHHQVASPAAVD